MQFVLSCAFSGSPDPMDAHVTPPDNSARQIGNNAGTWISPSCSGDWTNQSASIIRCGRSSQDWLPIPSFGPATPMISPSSSSSASSSIQRYGTQHEVPTHDGTVPVNLDRSLVTLTDPTSPNNRSMKTDSSIHVYTINHLSGSVPQTLPPSDGCVSDMNLSTEQCSPSCFPSQTVNSDARFPMHNAAIKFDRDYPRSHSHTIAQPTGFISRLTGEETGNNHSTCSNSNNHPNLSGANNNHNGSTTTNNSPSSSIGNSNNSLNAPLTSLTSANNTQHQHQHVNSAETGSNFQPRFACTTESLGELSAATNRAFLEPRRSFQMEPSRLSDLRVRYKHFF